MFPNFCQSKIFTALFTERKTDFYQVIFLKRNFFLSGLLFYICKNVFQIHKKDLQ